MRANGYAIGALDKIISEYEARDQNVAVQKALSDCEWIDWKVHYVGLWGEGDKPVGLWDAPPNA